MNHSPFRRMNGRPQQKPAPPVPVKGRLADIPEDKWEGYRDAQVNAQALRALQDLPAYNLSHPIVVPVGRNDAGDQQIMLHQGMGWRETIAKDLLAGALSSKILQPGVVGAHRAIPDSPEEQHAMIVSAMKMADMFVNIAHKMREQDLDTIKMKMANQFDAQYAADKAKVAEAQVVR